MALSEFDRFFLNPPPFDKDKDFYPFWERSISELKRIPIDKDLRKNKKKSTRKFTVFDTVFTGFGKTKIKGDILIPQKTSKPEVMIHIHDYSNIYNYSQNILDDKIAYYFMTLRGHDQLDKSNDSEMESPEFIVENILDKDAYYLKGVFLDVYRSVEMLRLVNELDCKVIGIIGKGLGAAAAVFTAAFTNRIGALVLDTPSFCHLPLSQNRSTSYASNEINEFIALRKNKKNIVKKNLAYFDSLNFTDKVKCPILATVGFKDTISPPECVFSLFNHLLCEKTIEVYPEDGNQAGGDEQFIKSIKWLIKTIIK